jgi:polyhydroxybutyrate depolymerase
MRGASIVTLTVLLGCSHAAPVDGGGTGGKSTTSGATSSGTGGSGGGPIIGGDRPVKVIVPTSYSASTPTPLVVMLHGYGVDGAVEELYLDLTGVALARGYLYAIPNGTIDTQGNYFWNATDACCDYDGSTVDDSAYLSSVITQIEAAWNVDPKRVFFIGHSNGGFMGYRMICDHSDQIAALVSLAGAMWEDVAMCKPAGPVNLLEVHGDADTEVFFDGGAATPGPGNGAYPSAQTSVTDWATFDGCALTANTSLPPLDIVSGNETTVEAYTQSCKPGGSAELWRIVGGSHLPNINDTFREDVFTFFDAHAKP